MNWTLLALVASCLFRSHRGCHRWSVYTGFRSRKADAPTKARTVDFFCLQVCRAWEALVVEVSPRRLASASFSTKLKLMWANYVETPSYPHKYLTRGSTISLIAGSTLTFIMRLEKRNVDTLVFMNNENIDSNMKKSHFEFSFAHSFFHVTWLGPNVGDHICHAVATNWVLKHVRQLWLTKLHERFARVGEADDRLFKKRQRLVYVLSLFLRNPLRLSFSKTLRSGQIDQIQLGNRVLLARRWYRLALDADREYAVRPRALLV